MRGGKEGAERRRRHACRSGTWLDIQLAGWRPTTTPLNISTPFNHPPDTHTPNRYALFYLLREIGTLRGSMGEFIDHVRTAGSPTQQLKLLNTYRPAELALTGASEEQWDAAVYTTLDRATLLKRLVRTGGAGRSNASGASSPASSFASGSSRGSTSADMGAAFSGPVVALLPRDRLGALMLDATRQALGRPASSNQAEVLHIPLETRHTECLLSEQGRKATAVILIDAIRAVLPRL